MRELESNEVDKVSGGFVGTPIPFYNGFIPMANWPGGLPGIFSVGSLTFAIAYRVGEFIYSTTEETFGMSTGEAIYIAIH
jgi:hypothetical protein|tara:strand:- start:329 stop:568 length:240 start_codon:yes stop_codon:yes gene_type:complete